MRQVLTTPQRQHSPDWYQRLLAWVMAHDSDDFEAKMRDRKRTLFADLQGRVLEIGPGVGPNLSYYSPDIQWIGIEPNPYMHTYLRQEAERLGLNIEIHPTTAEHLEFADNSIDAVVSTLVLCSVEDLEGTLQEILRVLKPGGRFYFLEHVAAPQGTWLRRMQQWIRPVWKKLGDGCRPDRETWVALEQAGFEQVEYQRFQAPVLAIVRPQIIGVAMKTKH